MALVTAIVPGVFWLWVFTHGRSYRGVSVRALLVTFLLGTAAVIPAGFIEFLVLGEDDEFVGSGVAALGTLAVAMFFVVGPVEEISKFLAVRLWVFRTHHLREPIDGLIYGAAASLGFATAENIGYSLIFGPEVMIVRGPISTLGHVIFGSIWAVSLNPRLPAVRRFAGHLPALAAAAGVHGLFNVLVFTQWGILPGFGLVIAGSYIVVRLFRRMKAGSEYHLRRNVPRVVCDVCSTANQLNDNFCRHCGTPASALAGETLECANCHRRTDADARFCGDCGDLFVFES